METKQHKGKRRLPMSSARCRQFDTLAASQRGLAADQCLVLQYYRVASLCHDPLQLAVEPHHFEMHVEYLAGHFRILSVDEMAAHLVSKEPFSGPSVVL